MRITENSVDKRLSFLGPVHSASIAKPYMLNQFPQRTVKLVLTIK